jgi:CDP-diacylglycerol--glycerol-3-phosphate 3-phosphatidyltransferase
VLFGLAMLTDKIDGDLARKHNLITNFGKIADPIADKALTGMAFIGLSIIGELWWWVTIVVLVREWSVTLMRLSVAKHVVIAANQGGKIKTVLQTVALGGLILPLLLLDGTLGDIAVVVWWIAVMFMAAAVAMTVWTGIDFFRKALSQRRVRKAATSV